MELDCEEESSDGHSVVGAQGIFVIVERNSVDRSVAIKVVHGHSNDLSIKVKVVNEIIIPEHTQRVSEM